VSAALDVNVLLYASDSSSALSKRAQDLLAARASGPELLYLWWGTLMSYIRIATHPSIFTRPLTAAEAEANVGALIALPQVRVLHEEDGFWQVYQEVTGAVPVRGNLVPDAHLASILRQHGVQLLYTNDSDFRKFAFLETRNPFS
jgi:uncharacterized protein